MKKNKKTKTEKKGLPKLSELKVGKDGYKTVTGVYDSEFFKFEDVGDSFEGKFIEIIEAGKRGEEKPCALFQQKKTNKSFLLGNSLIMSAVNEYGQGEYRIEFTGKRKGKKFTYSNFKIGVK